MRPWSSFPSRIWWQLSAPSWNELALCSEQREPEVNDPQTRYTTRACRGFRSRHGQGAGSTARRIIANAGFPMEEVVRLRRRPAARCVTAMFGRGCPACSSKEQGERPWMTLTLPAPPARTTSAASSPCWRRWRCSSSTTPSSRLPPRPPDRRSDLRARTVPDGVRSLLIVRSRVLRTCRTPFRRVVLLRAPPRPRRHRLLPHRARAHADRRRLRHPAVHAARDHRRRSAVHRRQVGWRRWTATGIGSSACC